ncbi:dual specificity protein kinase Ttk [Engraulis encrasicolus]|uniref:dual specificity protein kinase Ttk n=1 Tax=Engraulis encrasicolus TaxID=184585 RepID=UPI002FD0D088
MEEEEHTDRGMQFALLCQKLQNIQRNINDDDTDNINKLITSNSPDSCLTYLTNLEKKGNPHADRILLNKLMDCYSQVFCHMPMGKYCQNQSYARMLVRFAELKAIQDVREAPDNFNVAISHCQDFAFVHIAYAQFELNQGNVQKSAQILQRAYEMDAKPTELLQAAMQNLKAGRNPLSLHGDKENIAALTGGNGLEAFRAGSDLSRGIHKSDQYGESPPLSIMSSGTESRTTSNEEQIPFWRSSSHHKRPSAAMPGRVPLIPLASPEDDRDDMKHLNKSEMPHLNGNICRTEPRASSNEEQIAFWRSSSHHKRPSAAMPGRVALLPFSIPEDDSDDLKHTNKSEMPHPNGIMSRQTSGSRVNTALAFSESKKSSWEGELSLKPVAVSPESRPWEDIAAESTTTLLHRADKKSTSPPEDTTERMNLVIGSNSPESCWTYLLGLERMGDPRSDSALLTRLLQCYSRVFAKLPLSKHSKNESYARMLVRFAELKGIEDPDEAQDNFIVARSNSRDFAFVHIAHAQFELSQGNKRKSTLILQKALGLKAKPIETLELALQNLKAGKTRLTSAEDKENIAEPAAPTLSALQRDWPERKEANAPQPPASQAPQKPLMERPSSEWKLPARIPRYVSPEDKKPPMPPLRTPRLVDPLPPPSSHIPTRLGTGISCQTPNYKDLPPNSFVTPVMKQRPQVVPTTLQSSQPSHTPLPQTPQNRVSTVQQTPQGSVFSNESITIKGQQFFILKMIGSGGSSKVYQVLDHKKQLYAIKYVDLQEADTPTVEGYKNEIEHLNHLQQYSEQIIKLYDYEITSSHIYMVMECGNLDLNTWLRKRKTVNALERKFYWGNMLEAVQTIHKHGIVHSDLKPANFVIVNASLKLIDFGIANRIQPDTTSIMKDNPVGTLNYMPPEAIRDTSAKAGQEGTSKISPKGDVWSLGCILYCMTYGKTPFQSITNHLAKMHAIIDPKHEIEFRDISEKDLLDVLKRCLVRNPKERISIAELLGHPYLQIRSQQPPTPPEPEKPCSEDLKRILNELAALQSPNSIARAASNLAKMCNSGKRLDVAECVKTSSQTSWKI